MRYMALIYAQTTSADPGRESAERNFDAHIALMEEATRAGVFVGAEPLGPAGQTVRVEDGRTVVTDGPFAESKEQVAGYYIFDCPTIEEATTWAAKIPTACRSTGNRVEIRPMPGIPTREQALERYEATRPA